MAKLLPIKIYPDPVLRKKCTEIKTITDDIKRLISDMKKTMLGANGIGLAAPQVGKTIRLIIVNTKDGPMELINPVITKRSWGKEVDTEGCLSIPEFFGPVKRSRKISATFLDKKGNKQNVDAEGLFARVIQHEVDHINGVLFIDYLKKKDLKDLKK